MRIKGKVPARVAATNERKRSNAAGPHKGANLPRDERERRAIKDASDQTTSALERGKPVTLDTRFVVGACEAPDATAAQIYAECRRMLNTPEHVEERRSEAGVGGVAHIDHPPGLGLAAWLSIKYRPAGPAEPLRVPEPPEGYSEEEGDEDYEEAAYEARQPFGNGFGCVEVSWDTGYGYRDRQGRSCSDLHAGYVAELGKWCDERGIAWKWFNEYECVWYDRFDSLEEFGHYHDQPGGPSDWFTNQVLPVIGGQV